MHKIYKPIGVTPFELVQKFKLDNKIDGKVSFSGRLDPMAHGEMVLLTGDEIQKAPIYNTQRTKNIDSECFWV